MKKIYARIQELRREEAGFMTMGEAIVATGLLVLFGWVCMTTVIGFTQLGADSVDYSQGTNQGPVADTAKKIYAAASEYRKDFPEATISKDALITGGYIDLPNHYVWNVGSGASGDDICAVTFSSAEQTDRYTAFAPAEYNFSHQHFGAASPGCWGAIMDDQGKPVHVPNFPEVHAGVEPAVTPL